MASSQMHQALRSCVEALSKYAPDSVGAMLNFSLLDCDEEKGVYRFQCETDRWMRNVSGTLHGGMCAAILDQAMGFVVYCIQPGKGFSPTAEMQISYHRPIIPGKELDVCVWVLSRGKNLMHLRAEARVAGSDALCVSSTAIYCFKPADGQH